MLARHEGLRIPLRGRAQAAVLMAFFEGPEGRPELLLIRRAEGEARHAGQVSFPGGHVEAGERVEDAALRETAEECGLSPAKVQVLGQHDDCVSIHEVVVSTVVAWLDKPPSALVAEPDEVARIFAFDWAAIEDFQGYEEKNLRGYRIPYWTLPGRGLEAADSDSKEETLWGLTGHMVRSLIRDL